MKKYPNLEAILTGRVSGEIAEWPVIRGELQSLVDNYRDLAELLCDAELITRSRCHELTGMSNAEMVALLRNSPIAREVASRCAEIAEPCGRGAMMSNVGPTVAAAIRQEFKLSV